MVARFVTVAVAFVLTALPRPAAAQTPASPDRPTSVGTAVDAAMITQYARVKRMLQATIEMMPENEFGLKPGAGSRSFAETAAHIGVSNLGQCSGTNGRPLPREAQQARLGEATSKPALVKLFADGFAECDQMFATPGTDRTATSRAFFIVHSWEVYGSLAVYLRMKGLVPPSTQEEQARRSGGTPVPHP